VSIVVVVVVVVVVVAVIVIVVLSLENSRRSYKRFFLCVRILSLFSMTYERSWNTVKC